jgi:hypothetical protein
MNTPARSPSDPSQTSYYYVNGQRVPLVSEPGVYGVKFQPGARSDSAALSRPARKILRQESEHVDFLPNYGIQIYRTQSEAKAVPLLRREAAIEYVAPAFRQSPQSEDVMFATNRFVVQFKPEVTQAQIDQINAQHQAHIIEPLGYAANGYLLEIDRGADLSAIAAANAYYESGLTIFANPDFVKKIYRRSLPTALRDRQVATRSSDYLDQQWHLRLAQVIAAWEIPGLVYPQGSPEITIAILDDGVDVLHPEFDLALADGSSKVTEQFDFAANIADGKPKSAQDNHGTACAGVATAGGTKAYGAAPGCKLMAIRTPSYLGVADEAKMFQWVADRGSDIMSCSWGPQDGIGSIDPLPDSTRAAIHYCVTQGRSGKGIPIFWAAGNGDEPLEKAGQPTDGYATNPDVMAIAASTDQDTRSWYSDYGPQICVCAPSSGDFDEGEQAIFTTDRTGSSGYNPGISSKGDSSGSYTNDFGGTSAAAPLVAGIAALMLSAKPDLTPSEIRAILQQTAERIGDPGDYDATGHSDKYGYGRVNACAAVQAALGDQVMPTPTERPSIQAPATTSRFGEPPTFEVDPSPNSFYIVEVCAQPELFDITHYGNDRTDSNFYGSWSDSAHCSEPQYTLPVYVWENLKSANALYYRVGSTANETGWDNYLVSTPDAEAANAPLIQLIDDTPIDDSSDTPINDTPIDDTPIDDSSDTPIEDGTDTDHSDIDDSSSDTDNSDTNHDSSSTDSDIDTSTDDLDSNSSDTICPPEGYHYEVPLIAQPDKLSCWAASMAMLVSYQRSASMTPESLAEEVGRSLRTSYGWDMLEDVKDYFGFQEIPLPSNASLYPSPEQWCQWLGEYGPLWVTTVGAPSHAIVVCGLYGDGLYGDGQYGDLTPAGTTIEVLNPWDTSQTFSSDEIDFDPPNFGSAYAQTFESFAADFGMLGLADYGNWRVLYLPGTAVSRISPAHKQTRSAAPTAPAVPALPAIVGAETYDRTAAAPTFMVVPGENRFFAVEVATDWMLFDCQANEMKRNAQNFFGSWEQQLQEANGETVYTLPEAAWSALRTANSLYYRVVTAADRTGWLNYQTSTPDARASEAPLMQLIDRQGVRFAARSLPIASYHSDEALWRSRR